MVKVCGMLQCLVSEVYPPGAPLLRAWPKHCRWCSQVCSFDGAMLLHMESSWAGSMRIRSRPACHNQSTLKRQSMMPRVDLNQALAVRLTDMTRATRLCALTCTGWAAVVPANEAVNESRPDIWLFRNSRLLWWRSRANFPWRSDKFFHSLRLNAQRSTTFRCRLNEDFEAPQFKLFLRISLGYTSDK